MPVTFHDEEEEKRVAELRRQEEEELARMLSQKYGVEYADLSRVSINTDALRLLPEEEARKANAAVFRRTAKKIDVGALAPEADTTKQVVASLTERGFSPTLYMVSQESLKRAWEYYKDLSFATETKAGVLDISEEELKDFEAKVKTLDDLRGLVTDTLGQKKAYRLSRIFELVLAGSLSVDASDVHLEPQEDAVRLRYRLDGVLTDIIDFDHETYHLLASRVKLISGLKLNITKEAQDGRFSIKQGAADMEIRTSVLPGPYGEAIVLRVLNPKTIGVPLEELGIEPKLLKFLSHSISKPNGMILTTGPTGSGKTTTLYAFLSRIYSPQIKIITIEDPIEYHLKGIVQTQVDRKNYTFASGLRSSLRQDPDVIMVGEIRDAEVAETAINASLTGHMVFSTLHTNDAAGTFPRLIDLKVNPKVISSALTIALAQRLVRKLCSACKKETALSESEQKLADAVLASIEDKALVPKNRTGAFSAVGCPACNNTGYKGRIGIFEGIVVDKQIEEVVEKNPSEREIWQAARPQGLLTMQQDGVIKVLSGVTSFEELSRVIDLEERYV